MNGSDQARAAGDDVEDRGLWTRRFIAETGLAVLAVQLLPTDVDAWADAGGDARDTLIVRFTPGFLFHTHDLLIPFAVLREPPTRGVELETTEALFHRHAVTLSHNDLVTVSRGGSVSGRASSHTYRIALGRTRGARTPLLRSRG